MRPLLILLFILLISAPCHAWNATSHRISALIAWQQMGEPARSYVSATLAEHPDHPRWREKAGSDDPALILAEASTWADSIRHDPRFADDDSELPRLPGFPDMQRNSDWHYVDFDRQGQRGRGQIDRRILHLSTLLASSEDAAERAWALPWLIHLVADLHQPFHAGYSEDRGGNTIVVENPFDARQPFVKLHGWWDDLPAPASLRGKRLRKRAGELLARHPAPEPGTVHDWLRESRALLPHAYPQQQGSVSLLIDAPYRDWARATAERRLSDAGHRLGQLIEKIHAQRVSRETRRKLRPAN